MTEQQLDSFLFNREKRETMVFFNDCLLYTSDAADE